MQGANQFFRRNKMKEYKTPEESKPYLQDLFDHMRNEHGLILTQSEMQEIVQVCDKSEFSENAQLREALRELVDSINMLTYSIAQENRKVNNDFFAETMDSLAKAKELLNKSEIA